MARASSVVSARAMALDNLTQPEPNPQLADLCSAPMAGFYAAVDNLRLHQTLTLRLGTLFNPCPVRSKARLPTKPSSLAPMRKNGTGRFLDAGHTLWCGAYGNGAQKLAVAMFNGAPTLTAGDIFIV